MKFKPVAVGKVQIVLFNRKIEVYEVNGRYMHVVNATIRPVVSFAALRDIVDGIPLPDRSRMCLKCRYTSFDYQLVETKIVTFVPR